MHDFWQRTTFIADMMRRLKQLWHRIPQRHALLWGMLVASVPILIAEVLLRAIGGGFTRLLPIYSDEVGYWLQGRAWHAAQFNAGYFSLNEHTAPLAWSHYGSHGIFVAMVYGIVDVNRLDRIVVTNTVIFAICGVAAALIARWSWREAVACLVVLSLFPFVITMMPASMQEIIHAGIAIVLAAGFWRLMDGSPVRIWLILGIMLAMLLRPTWGILLLPAFLLHTPGMVWYLRGARMVAAAGVMLAMTLLMGATAAPFPTLRSGYYADMTSIADALIRMWEYTLYNVGAITRPTRAVFTLQRVLAILVVVAVMVQWVVGRLQRRPLMATGELLLHLVNIVGMYVAMTLLYEFIDGRDFRVVGAHLLFSVVLVILRHHWILFYAVCVWSVVTLPATWQHYQSVHAPRFASTRTIPTLSQHLTFVRQHPTWCNTVDVSIDYVSGMNEVLLAIPPGFGLTVLTGAPPDVINAKYLILVADQYATLKERMTLTPLMPVRNGVLYLNATSSCP